MEESIYTYVNKFPVFKSIISGKGQSTNGSHKTNCECFRDEKLTEYTEQNKLFLEICPKISEHHKDIISKAESSQIGLCKYINYWIYDTLKLMPNLDHNALLNKFYEKVVNLNFCKTYKIPINKKTYEELNELSKLYESFIKLKKESAQVGTGSCDGAKEFFELYEKSAGKCKSNYNNYVCWELIKIRAEYEQNRAFAKGCKDQIKYLTRIEDDRFTSFDSWLRSKLPGAKKKTNKLVHKMHELQNTSEMEGRRYKLPYHSS